jgi:hypothetical protein
MPLFIEEFEQLQQLINKPIAESFFNYDYMIMNENKMKHGIAQCLNQYQQNHDAVTLFKEISYIIDNDVKNLAALEQESDAYLPLLLSVREKLVLNLIRELNLNKDKNDRTAAINDVAIIYDYLQQHLKNPDWFDNPQAYESTRTSNFKILAELNEQTWIEEVRNQIARKIDG